MKEVLVGEPSGVCLSCQAVGDRKWGRSLAGAGPQGLAESGYQQQFPLIAGWTTERYCYGRACEARGDEGNMIARFRRLLYMIAYAASCVA